jgi:hypothetical protein
MLKNRLRRTIARNRRNKVASEIFKKYPDDTPRDRDLIIDYDIEKDDRE